MYYTTGIHYSSKELFRFFNTSGCCEDECVYQNRKEAKTGQKTYVLLKESYSMPTSATNKT
jgi:hypothetical protein